MQLDAGSAPLQRSGAAAPPLRSARGLVQLAVHLVAVGAGLVLGFGFGRQIGGVLVALMASLTGAMFCALIADALLDRLMPVRRAPPDGDAPPR